MKSLRNATIVCTFIQLVASAVAEAGAGEKNLPFKLHQKGITPGPRTSPDGKLTLMIDGLSAQLIEVATGKVVGGPLVHRSLRKDSGITTWAFSPDGRKVAIGTGDPRGKALGDSAGEVRVWEVATGKLLHSIHPAQGDIGYVRAIAFSPDGKHVLVDCLELSGK
jgi:WD40 repeat protein